jgi:RNA polymerase sigma-70 factor, ECF subfamily
MAQPDPTAQPDGAQPDGAQPDGAQPDGAQPDGAQPDGAQPDGAQPDGAQPEGAQPGAKPPRRHPPLPQDPGPAPRAPKPGSGASPHGVLDGMDADATAALIVRAQSGDAEALNDLFTLYHGALVEQARRRLGPRLRAKEEPDDLAQTTFREAARDFPRYRHQGGGSLLRWLIQILQNKIRDRAEFYSANKRDLEKERSIDIPDAESGGSVRAFEPEAPDLSVTVQVQRAENFQLLRQALRELSDDHRQAITLVFFQGKSLREAGVEMGGRSEDAVRMLLRRAEERMAELLRASVGKDLQE